MATRSSVLAWRIPGRGEPGGLLSMESHRVGHDWSDLAAAAADKGMNKCLLHSHFRGEEQLRAYQIQIQDILILKLPWWLSVKESAFQCRRHGIHSWFRKIPWRREWQLTPVFLPGKSHGQRRLAGHSPWDHKESDMTEWLSTHTNQKGLSPVAQMVQNPLSIQETWVWPLDWEDPLDEGMATTSSILAWRIPMNRGAWWDTVHEVAKSQTWLSD